MIELPVGTLPVDFLTLFMALFRNLAENQTGRDRGFQATIMKSSVDEVRGKETEFLQGNFDNVRFSENYCFAAHKVVSFAAVIRVVTRHATLGCEGDYPQRRRRKSN